MAKTSKVVRNAQRRELIVKYAAKRAELKKVILDPKTGRPRGFVRQFGLGRNKFRELALNGFLPGVTKASW
jgi:small subunit ribosomal protein S14